MRHSMGKLNYNRPVHQQNRDRHKQPLTQDIPNPKVLRFGKYKGSHISTIPDKYLEWLISITPDDSFAIIYATELSKRKSYVKRLKK